MRCILRIGFLAALAAGWTLADVTFEQSIKYTGGSMVELMHRMANNPMLGRAGGGAAAAFQDQTMTVYVKGSKMARVGPVTSSITDLDAGTITIVNHERHTYSTQTFEEMRQRLEEMQQRMNRGQTANIDFDVKVDKTGQTRDIDGQTATETIIMLTGKPSSSNAEVRVRVDAWLVPGNASTREVVDYLRRLSGKFAYAFGGSPALGAAAGAINAAMKAGLQLDGYPALSDMEVSGVSSPMMGRGNADPKAPFLKTETHSTNFVAGPVDDSKFAVPAGYTQEQPRAGGGRPQ